MYKVIAINPEQLISPFIDNGDQETFNTACQEGNLAVVSMLSSQSVHYVSTKNKNGITPLHFAAHYGHEDIVKLLLEVSLKGQVAR